jgi:hypothetical protein
LIALWCCIMLSVKFVKARQVIWSHIGLCVIVVDRLLLCRC